MAWSWTLFYAHSFHFISRVIYFYDMIWRYRLWDLNTLHDNLTTRMMLFPRVSLCMVIERLNWLALPWTRHILGDHCLSLSSPSTCLFWHSDGLHGGRGRGEWEGMLSYRTWLRYNKTYPTLIVIYKTRECALLWGLSGCLDVREGFHTSR